MPAEANPDLFIGLKEILSYMRLTEPAFRILYSDYGLKGDRKVAGLWIGQKKQLDQYLQALTVQRARLCHQRNSAEKNMISHRPRRNQALAPMGLCAVYFEVIM
ncbi:MAG TPA: hypothetical protein VMT62_13145 [Syntrophorhabdaceae bacterium]|nr:hypothetical protein [Syntrophorhabdaceae bacterium]